MEPIPEVRAAATQLAAVADETMDLLEHLRQVSALAVQLIPSCVGVSISVVVDGDPFTVTATAPDIVTLDAIQYVDGGPCVDAATAGEPLLVDDVLDEQRWQLFGQAAAAHGVRASLSIPLHRQGGEPFGALNLYAGEIDAFDGVAGRLADLFGVHVDALVRNADLSFLTRDEARQLPQRLKDHERVNQAVGLLIENRGWSVQEARERMELAAVNAHSSMPEIAEAVLVLGLD